MSMKDGVYEVVRSADGRYHILHVLSPESKLSQVRYFAYVFPEHGYESEQEAQHIIHTILLGNKEPETIIQSSLW